MTDPYIQKVADQNRATARQFLDWDLDALRLHAGLVEPVEDRPEDRDILRLRRMTAEQRMAEQPRDTRLFFCRRPCAPYPHFHEIRDKKAVA